MLSIYICEDDPRQRKRMEFMVKDHLAIKNYKDVQLTMSTDCPSTLLSELKKHSIDPKLYFLDVDLQHEMDGIVLASEIRKMDPHGKIVFVTTHGELAHLTFLYKVEALDYILKDTPETIADKVGECIDLAVGQLLHSKESRKGGYKVKVGSRIRFVPFDDIIFFESSTASSRKIILHMENSWLEFYGSLSEVEEISPEFFRCHQSFVINLNNIESVNIEKKTAEMRGGRQAFIAVRKVGALLKRANQI